MLRGPPDPDILFVTISLLGISLAASLVSPHTLPLTTASSAVTDPGQSGRIAAYAVAAVITAMNVFLIAQQILG